jgi:hypothetical protein
LSIEQVSNLLAQIVSGELSHDQIEHIRCFLAAGVDITSLML